MGVDWEQIAKGIQEAEVEFEKVLAWCKTHESEMEEVDRKTYNSGSFLITKFSMSNPALLIFSDVLTDISKAFLVYGYYLGRHYQDVPKVFKEALGED